MTVLAPDTYRQAARIAFEEARDQQRRLCNQQAAADPCHPNNKETKCSRS